MSDPKRSRRHFTTEQKVAIRKRHMVDKATRDARLEAAREARRLRRTELNQAAA